MSTIPSGAVKFSEIQSVLGGTNPIKFSEYYADATEGYSTGVSGIPNKNALISVSMFRGKAKAGGNGLYTFTSHTFTNASVTGRSGPTLSQCRTAYSATAWTQDATNNYLDMTTQGIQLWKVPATGSYTIECFGASGGTNIVAGGKGARIKGDFSLTQGEVIAILVGQEGGLGNSGCNTGGGGGTFVWKTASTTEPLIVAGGGGGNNSANVGLDASTTTSGTGSGGTPGTNGNGANPGGSGWKSNGAAGLDNNNSGCARPLDGGLGGLALGTTTVGNGGFGGGASASGQPCGNGGAGGGGGYSGGSGPATTTASNPGGGGGSFNSGSNTSSSVRTDSGNGSVSITANFTITTIASLYTFTSHTFTNASATGRNGPTLSECRTAYTSATWTQDATNNYFNMTTQGIQLWTVPETRSYTITVIGASSSSSVRAAQCVGTISLTRNDVLKIVVGQQGGTQGGNGGSFVLSSSDTLYIAAGGTGGRGDSNYGSTSTGNASTTTFGNNGMSGGGSVGDTWSGKGGSNGGGGGAGSASDNSTSGGTGGNGADGGNTNGNSPNAGAGGGGIVGKGGNTAGGGVTGGSGGSGAGNFVGGTGGGGAGGFGGGGGGSSGGGGGGGYSGGGGGAFSNTWTGANGGGGGSYVSPTLTTTSISLASVGPYHGSVVIAAI